MSPKLVIEDRPDVLHQRMDQLNMLRKSRHFCDVVLQVGSSEIHAHRAVLACASPYFFELFTSEDERKSAHEGKLLYKLSNGFERESVEHLVNYAYTGRLEVPDATVKAVFIAAKRLKLESVAQASGEYLVAHLTPESCLAVRAINGIASNKELVARVDDYIQQLGDLVQVTQDAMSLPRLQVTVIHRNQDEAAITGRALCSLVLDWIRKQMEEEELQLDSMKEKKHMLYLNIDNSLHDCSDIRSGDLHDSDIVQDYKKMSRKLSQTNMKVRRKSTTPQPVRPRLLLYSRSISDMDESEQESDWKLIAYSQVSESSWVAVVALHGSVAVILVQQKVGGSSSPTSTPVSSRPASVEKVDCYTIIPHMTSPKCATGTGNFNDQMLVCGGYDRGECLRTVEAYDPKTNKWVEQPAMQQGRGRFDLTVLDGRAYAIGGCDGSRELSSVEVLEKNAKKWTSVAPLPLARSNTGVCNLGSQVYCIGGWNGQYGIKQCDVYTPESNTWMTIAPLHVGRYQAGVAAFNNAVYAAGGCDSWNCLNSVEVYDPITNVWKFAAPMTTPRRGCGAEAFKGKLYVIGGSDGTHSLCTTEIYDPETNAWMPGPSMTTCRANVGVAVVDGRLYAVGGFSGKNFLNSIEYLDPISGEWTNFTPKPEGLSVSGEHCGFRERERSATSENGDHQHNDHGILTGMSNGHVENGCNGLSNGHLPVATCQ